MAENTMDLQVNITPMKAGVHAATIMLQGLTKVADELGAAISDAFTIGGYQDYLKTVRRFGKGLTDELLVMQLRFGTMKAAIADACAPLAAAFVPMVNDAIGVVTRFAGSVGEFFRGMVTAITGRDALAESAEKAAQAEDQLTESAKKSGSAVRRSLMHFDQINRLNGGSGGSKSSTVQQLLAPFQPGAISDRVQRVVDNVMRYLKPLLELDFSRLKAALQGLWEKFTQLGAIVGKALEGLWFSVLTPFITWVTETLAPALTDCFASKLDMVTAALAPLMAGLSALWQALQPVIAYIGSYVMTAISGWQGAYEKLAAVFREKSPQITGILQNIATVLSRVWSLVQPVLENMRDRFGRTFSNMSTAAAGAVGFIIDQLHRITSVLASVFTGNWKKAWEGVKGIVVSAVNGIIGVLNSMLSGIGTALNRIVRSANSLSFSIPDWMPVLGGKRFSPSLRFVAVPQIPLLAQGAVLPANKPFLAMVGDQHHGTNVEAPLATIQQAVAQVMQDQIASNMAGHNATVAVLGDILQAVLGISIGDDVIGAAAERYNRKIAIMKGV